jgi:hypothetical protein
VEVGRTTVGISPEAGARDDRAGVILVCLSEPGAGAKQEQRLFRDLPELLSTAADGPVIGRGFWLNIFTLLAVGLECVVLIVMAGQFLT